MGAVTVVGDMAPRRTDHLVDYRLAAAWLEVTPGVIRHMIHEGKLRRYGTPRRILVDVVELYEARKAVAARRARTPA